MRRLASSISTAEKLKQAFFSCLNEKEYRDITIAELSGRAGINRTTFYLFCESKDECFRELCFSLVDQWFQRFFDLNIAKNTEAEKELFYQLLLWVRQWRPALRRILLVRTESFDGFTLFAEEVERKMKAQDVFRTADEKKRKRYDLFIKVYSVGLASIVQWLFNEINEFDADVFRTMIEQLRHQGYYSILNDDRNQSTGKDEMS